MMCFFCFLIVSLHSNKKYTDMVKKNRTHDTVEGYLSDPDFKKNVTAIAVSLNVNPDSETFKDISQECAIAVISAFNSFDPSKTGELNFFWGYAYPRMYERAKNETNKQRNTVAIPYNRINKAYSNKNRKYNYEQITHTYTTLQFDCGDSKMFCGVMDKDVGLDMDIKKAIESLPDMQRDVFKMKMGLKPTNSGFDTYEAIVETLGITRRKAESIFSTAKKAVKKQLMTCQDT